MAWLLLGSPRKCLAWPLPAEQDHFLELGIRFLEKTRWFLCSFRSPVLSVRSEKGDEDTEGP